MKIFDNYAILKGAAPALVLEISSTKDITSDASAESKNTVTPENRKTEIDFYPWGANDDMPDQLIKNAFKSYVVASTLDFNAKIGYGETVMPVRRAVDESGELKFRPVLKSEYPQIFEFLEDNNFPLIQQELVHDLTLLHNGFVELIMNKAGTKVLQIRHKEASYSRISVMNDKAEIEWHGYCSNWKDTARNPVVATRLLDYDNPLWDLKVKLGKKPGRDGKKKKQNEGRYVLHIGQPSPGKFYYQKAYWWSIFESHWFDFSCAIPEFKMNLMKNQMVIKYQVLVRKGFFEGLFKTEGLTDDKLKTARRIEFYQQLEDFLASKENAGKNFVSEFEYDLIHKGIEVQDIIIKPIESFIKGGEYIEDSEEASNAICYAMGVHPSLQGASPGKNKTINGTEARELFIIKQSLMKPLRDLLVQPLNIVKSINGWDPDIEFVIPNIQLTTLDKNTGAQKQIGNTKV